MATNDNTPKGGSDRFLQGNVKNSVSNGVNTPGDPTDSSVGNENDEKKKKSLGEQSAEKTSRKSAKTFANKTTKVQQHQLQEKAAGKIGEKALENSGMGWTKAVGGEKVATAAASKGIGLAVGAAKVVGKAFSFISYAGMLLAGNIRGFISSVVASFAGTFLGATGAYVALGGLLVGGGAGALTLVNQMNAPKIDDSLVVDCVIRPEDDTNGLSLDKTGVDTSEVEQRKNVEKTYSVMKTYHPDINDEQIAGMVGPWFAESGIQPKRYETDYLVKGKYDTLDKEGPTAEVLSGSWGSFLGMYNGSGLNEAGYLYEGKHYIGVGLGQWTGPRAKQLWDFAKSTKKSMFEMDTQLAFMIGPDSGKSRLDAYLDASKGSSASEASSLFLSMWEGVPGNKEGMRAEAANKWLIEIKKMKVDSSYAKGILSAANAKVGKSNGSSAASQRAQAQCDDGKGDTSQKGDKAANAGYLFNEPYVIGQGYGRYDAGGAHYGIDVISSAGEGAKVYTPVAGTVVVVNKNGEWGNGAQPGNDVMIKVDGKPGGYVDFSHLVMNSATVKVGDKVESGDQIGKMGNTGMSFGAHTHFEWDQKPYPGASGGHQNPFPFIKGVKSAAELEGPVEPDIRIDPTKK